MRKKISILDFEDKNLDAIVRLSVSSCKVSWPARHIFWSRRRRTRTVFQQSTQYTVPFKMIGPGRLSGGIS
jgi:hypothetical protein